MLNVIWDGDGKLERGALAIATVIDKIYTVLDFGTPFSADDLTYAEPRLVTIKDLRETRDYAFTKGLLKHGLISPVAPRTSRRGALFAPTADLAALGKSQNLWHAELLEWLAPRDDAERVQRLGSIAARYELPRPSELARRLAETEGLHPASAVHRALDSMAGLLQLSRAINVARKTILSARLQALDADS